jgi:hypothetical protein
MEKRATTVEETGPSYDPALGSYMRGERAGGFWVRYARTRFPTPYLLTKPLDTPYRVRKALGSARTAAAIICFCHVLWGVLACFSVYPPKATLIGERPLTLALSNAAGAIFALYLNVLLKRRAAPWAIWLLVGWSAIEFVPWLTIWLYGHGTWPLFALGAFGSAVLGVRGLNASRRKAA